MHLSDGRTCEALPWVAQTPCPWKPGYSRVFIEFTKEEKKNARVSPVQMAKNGHIQVIKNSKLLK